MSPRLAPLAALAALLLLVACGEEEGVTGPDAGSGARLDGSLAGKDAESVIHFPDTGSELEPPDASAPTAPTIIYAHTGKALYQGDPNTRPLALAEVGPIDCTVADAGVRPPDAGKVESMTDIAIDRSGQLYGVTSSAVYPLTVETGWVRCGAKRPLPSSGFMGLTFAPAGVLRETEMLVAANTAGELWSIDEQGQTTQVGSFGKVPANDGQGHDYKATHVGKDWELSGDIVFLTNGGNWAGFATVVDCPNPPWKTNCNAVDTLVEIDVSKLKAGNTASVTKSVRGQVVKTDDASCTDSATGYGNMYGVAAWNDKVYGFSDAKQVVEISNADGSACAVPNTTPQYWYGAGVTTLAPVILPPN